MKKEDKELVCKWLDRAIEFATEDIWYDCKTDKKKSIEISLDKIQQFKQDNDLLPENVSGWYLDDDYELFLRYQDYEKDIHFGINVEGDWFCGKGGCPFNANLYTPATKQQVEERLFPFFEKMGYVKGACVKSIITSKEKRLKGGFHIYFENKVYANTINGDVLIMEDGILAELIEENEVDKLKAEIRKLSDKLKELFLMNRQEKIESIRRGDSVIKNDMQGDERCLEVLNECEIGKRSSWADVDNTNYGFYGIDDEDDFYWLTEYEFDNRPQILMSELVEQKKNVAKSSVSNEDLISDIKSYNLQNVSENWDSTQGFDYGVESTIEHLEECGFKNPQPTEQKEVFTVENMSFDYNDVKTLTDAINKLNQMAFDAYK